MGEPKLHVNFLGVQILHPMYMYSQVTLSLGGVLSQIRLPDQLHSIWRQNLRPGVALWHVTEAGQA